MPEFFTTKMVPTGQLDVAVCIKQFWSSSELVQAPVIVLPGSYLDKVPNGGPRHIMERNQLSDVQIREYRKTANTVAAEPWSMHRAAKYLNAWLDQNMSGHWPAPAPQGWVAGDHAAEGRTSRPFSAEWSRFAPGMPVAMEVVRRRRINGKAGIPRSIPIVGGAPEGLQLPPDDDPVGEVVEAGESECGRGRGRSRGRGRGVARRPAAAAEPAALAAEPAAPEGGADG